MWKVVFPERLYYEIQEFLFSTAPHENGCYVTANTWMNKSDAGRFVVTGYCKPEPDSWKRRGEHSLEPSSEYINKCVLQADNNGETLIFIHTHPNPSHPATFSAVDTETNQRIFANLTQILDGRPLGSLVFSREEIAGVAFFDGVEYDISSVKVVGSTYSEIPTFQFIKQGSRIDPKFDRQTRVVGQEKQREIQNLKAAIIGVGGTGSSVAVQLARMGAKELVLVDMDNVDATNVTRLHGSKTKDIGRSKVEVVADYIAGFSKAKVTPIAFSITDADKQPQIISHLLDSDVIFGCTDTLASRAVLNDVSIQYYIPYIDVGCRILVDKECLVAQSIAKVQLVTPDHACLWCTGILDGSQITLETYPEMEKGKLAKEGYYQGTVKQPSTISLTTLGGSLAVNSLMGLLGVYGPDYPTMTQIELRNSFIVSETPPIKSDCICKKRRGIGSRRRVA